MELNKIIEGIKPSEILKFNLELNKISDVIRLTIGEPDFNTPEHIKDAAKKAIDENHSHYTYSRGIATLREEAVKYYKEKSGYEYNENQVIVTSGVSEAIVSVFQAILNPNDRLIIPTPSFPPYFAATIINRAEFDQVDTSESNFLLTAEKLRKFLDENKDKKYKAVVLIYPNNPTGVTYSKEELEELAEVIKENNLIAICDEIYGELVYEKKHYSLASFIPDNTIVLTGLSKSHAMTGWRVGFIFSSDKLINEISKTHELNIVNVTTISQYAALEALKNGKDDARLFLESYSERRKYILNSLDEMGIEYASPDGAFYVFVKIPDYIKMGSAEFAYELAHKAKVGVIPGEYFGKGGEGFVRMSYATSLENIKEGMNRIKRFLNK